MVKYEKNHCLAEVEKPKDCTNLIFSNVTDFSGFFSLKVNTDTVASLVSLSVDVSTNFYDILPNYLSQDTYLKTELI